MKKKEKGTREEETSKDLGRNQSPARVHMEHAWQASSPAKGAGVPADHKLNASPQRHAVAKETQHRTGTSAGMSYARHVK